MVRSGEIPGVVLFSVVQIAPAPTSAYGCHAPYGATTLRFRVAAWVCSRPIEKPCTRSLKFFIHSYSSSVARNLLKR